MLKIRFAALAVFAVMSGWLFIPAQAASMKPVPFAYTAGAETHVIQVQDCYEEVRKKCKKRALGLFGKKCKTTVTVQCERRRRGGYDRYDDYGDRRRYYDRRDRY